jgi:hypothetical protein
VPLTIRQAWNFIGCAQLKQQQAERSRRFLPLFEIALVLVRFDHVAGPGKSLAARGASASCGGFGFARNTTTFDIFNWPQVTANFGDVALFQSAPNRPDYIDVWALWLHGHDL